MVLAFLEVHPLQLHLANLFLLGVLCPQEIHLDHFDQVFLLLPFDQAHKMDILHLLFLCLLTGLAGLIFLVVHPILWVLFLRVDQEVQEFLPMHLQEHLYLLSIPFLLSDQVYH